MRSQSPDRIYLYHHPPGMYASQRIFDRGSTMLHLSRAILRYIFSKQSTGIANSARMSSFVGFIAYKTTMHNYADPASLGQR